VTQFTRIVKRVGLSEAYFHDLRPSTASFFVSLGVPLPIVQTILGYRRSGPMETQTPIDPSHIREALAKLEKALSLV
jgi:hypothetical protein